MTSTLGDRMKGAREALGLGFNELDRRAGKPGSGYASRVESGERANVSPPILAAYAKALGVNHEWLATGAGERQPPSPGILPPGANLPRLRAFLAVVAGDTDADLVRGFWDRASAANDAERVPALEWADRFVTEWMRAGKPGPGAEASILPPTLAAPLDQAGANEADDASEKPAVAVPAKRRRGAK